MNPAENPTTWLNAIWGSGLTSTQKIICAFLRSYMTDRGNHFAWPSVATIAEGCSLSRATVQRNLRKLCDDDVRCLRQDGTGPQNTTKYRIVHGGPHDEAGLTECAEGPHGAARINNEVNKDVSRGRFVKPTISEVQQYINEKSYNVVAEQFHSYYESNGWKVGRNPMTDWKAAVRHWHSKNKTQVTRQAAHRSSRKTTLHEDLNDTSWAN